MLIAGQHPGTAGWISMALVLSALAISQMKGRMLVGRRAVG